MKFLSALLALALVCSFAESTPAQGKKGKGGDSQQKQRGQRGARGQQGQRGRGGAMQQRGGGMSPLVMALDANRDGKISAAEIQNAAAALRKLDKNGDGDLTANELRPQGSQRGFGQRPGGAGGPGGANGQRPGGAGGFAQMMTRMDRNNDGKISRDEAPGRMKENFSRIDTNGDGFLDKAEMDELAKRFSARGQGKGGKGGKGKRGGNDAGPSGGQKPKRPAADD